MRLKYPALPARVLGVLSKGKCAVQANVPVAQWIAHQTSNLGFADSSPARDIFLLLVCVILFAVAATANLW
jgi:hypothetical protein